jgi:hypothetical protein
MPGATLRRFASVFRTSFPNSATMKDETVHEPAFQRDRFRLAPVRCVTPGDVWDDYGWCPPTFVTVRTLDSLGNAFAPPSMKNPEDLWFVVKNRRLLQTSTLAPLPIELGEVHTRTLTQRDEWVLAPYGIDDATDFLWEARIAADDVFELATKSVAGLFWGLHDWCHFHNHGPFIERAWTELQCDLSALAWILHQSIGLTKTQKDSLIEGTRERCQTRFHEEGKPWPTELDTWFERPEGLYLAQ